MDEKIEKAMKALKRHGFQVEYAADRGEARARLLELIGADKSVGVPGSATVRATGIVEALEERGQILYDHWKNTAPETRKLQLTSDVLITSANALSLTGEIVNMDGVGNRVAATIFGPAEVIFVVGKNKLADDLESARRRVKDVAAPKRARELNLKTPCAETGECTECNAPARVCRAEVILHRPCSLTRTTVILVGEELGN